MAKSKYDSQTAWNAEHTVNVAIKLNRNTDSDIIEFLETIEGSKAGYLKRLIREDMERKDRK